VTDGYNIKVCRDILLLETEIKVFEKKNQLSLFKLFFLFFLGEWNLYIENVTLNDEGEYKCTVTRRSDQINKQNKAESRPAVLKIMSKFC
jgi:hypothetical protein